MRLGFHRTKKRVAVVTRFFYVHFQRFTLKQQNKSKNKSIKCCWNEKRLYICQTKQPHKKTKIMKNQINTIATSTSTPKNETRVFIEWGNKETILFQFKNMTELIESGYLTKYAANFGYQHLVDREIASWSKHQVHNIFVTAADPKYNYGLDFQLWINYTNNEMNFMMKMSIGSSSISSSPLQRVNFNVKTPEGFDILNYKDMSHEMKMEWVENIGQKIYESFEFSTNAFYKKDLKYRPELRQMCSKYGFTFA